MTIHYELNKVHLIGSGQTGIAAMQTGRNFLGFEIDPRWCKLANARIEDAQAQGVLKLDN